MINKQVQLSIQPNLWKNTKTYMQINRWLSRWIQNINQDNLVKNYYLKQISRRTILKKHSNQMPRMNVLKLCQLVRLKMNQWNLYTKIVFSSI